MRSALGARRGDLVRSQLTEALLLAAAGGFFGALIAWGGVPLLVRAAPEGIAGGFGGAPIPGLATARLDPTALLFTIGISFIAACAFGLLPALRFSSVRIEPAPRIAFVVTLTDVRPGDSRLISAELWGEGYGRHYGRISATTRSDTAAATVRTVVFP